MNQAWEFDGEQVTPSPPSEGGGGDDAPAAPRNTHGNNGGAESIDGKSSSRGGGVSGSSGGGSSGNDSGDAARRRQRSGRRTRPRDGRFLDFDDNEEDDYDDRGREAGAFFERGLYDEPPVAGEVGRGVWGGGRIGSSSSSSGDVGGAFEPRRGKQRPPKTNQDAADAAGAGIVAALMEVRTPC